MKHIIVFLPLLAAAATMLLQAPIKPGGSIPSIGGPSATTGRSARAGNPVVFRRVIEGALRNPLAVAVSDSEDIFVADSGNGVVKRFRSTGTLEAIVGQRGENPRDPSKGDLYYPTGIAIGPGGNIYVSDLLSGRVSVFTQNGAFLSYFGESSDGSRPFKAPVGIHYRDGLFYVNDVELAKVLVLNSEGAVVRELGRGRGPNPEELAYASYTCTLVKDGSVWVADSNNSRVQVFDREGALTKVIAIPPGDEGLGLPRGLYHDRRGYLHVANALAHRVDVFNPDGKLLFSYGSSGKGEGQFGYPNGVDVHGDLIYVTDVANNRVQVWEYTG